MPRVSLILPMVQGDPRPDSTLAVYRDVLEQAGHEVEVIVSSGPGVEVARSTPEAWRTLEIIDAGLAAAAVAGLNVSNGDYLIVLDPRMGYPADALPRMVAPLVAGEADMSIATRFSSEGNGALWGKLAVKGIRPLVRTTDPMSGLIALHRSLRDGSKHAFTAAGSKFSLELLSKLGGRRVDVPVITTAPHRRFRPSLDEVRAVKRLADHRFGGVSHLAQFCLVGASGMIVDLSCYATFQFFLDRTPLAGLIVPPTKISASLALARTTAIAVALVWNFSLNRRMTFSYARGGSIVRQFATYVASNLLGVLVSLGVSLGLPRKVSFFAAHKIIAAVVGIVLATGISFSMSRWVVFRRKPTEPVHIEGPVAATDETSDMLSVPVAIQGAR